MDELKLTPEFIKDLHFHAPSTAIKYVLEEHFPQVFKDEMPLTPGLYRNANGKAHILFQDDIDGTEYWRLASSAGYIKAPDGFNLFNEHLRADMTELRRILEGMIRMED